jgi:hypothetical protein
VGYPEILLGRTSETDHIVLLRRSPVSDAVVRIAEACEAWLSRQGFAAEDEGDADEGDDTQAVIQQASLLGQAALGERAGKRARRAQVLGGKELALPPRCASYAGYSLHAGVGFEATDRAGLERLPCMST